MSAVQLEATPAPKKPQLSLVQSPTATVSTLGFAGIIVLLIALGLGGVMVLTTSVGAQSRELSKLRKEATELGYQGAALTSELQRVSSASALAMRATELGMVPNPYPAFINLADGTITGEPVAVQGNELPFLRGAKPASQSTPSAKPAAPSPSPKPATGDLVAAGTPGE